MVRSSPESLSFNKDFVYNDCTRVVLGKMFPFPPPLFFWEGDVEWVSLSDTFRDNWISNKKLVKLKWMKKFGKKYLINQIHLEKKSD